MHPLLSYSVPSLTNPLSSHSAAVEKDIPLEVDAGLLAVTDTNPMDEEAYSSDIFPKNLRNNSLLLI
jgi:hypothetical protein